MYWPIGTPRIYATSSSQGPAFTLFASDDGIPQTDYLTPPPNSHHGSSPRAAAGHDEVEIQPPLTPGTPITPAIQSVEHDDETADDPQPGDVNGEVPSKDPVLALRTSRTGNMFATITATSITLWQTKVRLSTWNPRHANSVKSPPSFSPLLSGPSPPFDYTARMSTSSCDRIPPFSSSVLPAAI